MIYNLQATVPLTWARGSDLGPASIIITAPDGTTVTASNIVSSAGTYSYAYTPTKAGLYQVLWTASLSGTSDAYEDVFEIRPNQPVALISLDDARTFMRTRTSDTSDNPTIQTIIEAASRLILDITGPMNTQTYTESFDGGLSTILPTHVPLIQVTSCIEYYGLAKFVLTEQPLGNQTNAFAFTVDYVTGEITRRTYGGQAALFAVGSKNVSVTYTAGRPNPPETVQLATKILVKHLYEHTQTPAGRPQHGAGRDEDLFSTLIGYAVPNFVVELLQPDRRAPGIA